MAGLWQRRDRPGEVVSQRARSSACTDAPIAGQHPQRAEAQWPQILVVFSLDDEDAEAVAEAVPLSIGFQNSLSSLEE